jgi:hypothetical protein
MCTVVAANRGILMLLAGVAEHLLVPPLNTMRITLHPEGLAPKIRNLPEWRGHLLAQMDRQLSLMRSPALKALYDEVAGYPAPGAREAPEPPEGSAGDRPAVSAAAPVGAHAPFALPLVIEHDGRVLSFVSTIATFNTPMDVTVSELALETFLPADPETARYLRDLTP